MRVSVGRRQHGDVSGRLWMGLFDHLSEDQRGLLGDTLEALQLGLDRLGGARPDRRPRWHEVDRLEVKAIRPLVQVGQVSVKVHVGAKGRPLLLSLLWLERWGGTFGPRSSAEANRNRSRPGRERFLHRLDLQDGTRKLDPERTADRGGRPAWLLYLQCPRCARRCRVLYSRRGQHQYGCPKCERPAFASNCWTPSGGRSAGPASKRERQRLMHQEAAARIRRQYLNDTGPRTGPLLAPAMATLPKPPRMTWERFGALARLVEAHETLAMMAALAGAQQTLARITGQEKGETLEHRVQEQNTARWARAVLVMDAWALRQRSWHRRGQPRDTPGQGTRARLAREAAATTEGSRLEPSLDVCGHG